MDCDPVMSLTQSAGEVPDEAEEVVHKSFYSDHNLYVSDENSEYNSSSWEQYMEEVNIGLEDRKKKIKWPSATKQENVGGIWT